MILNYNRKKYLSHFLENTLNFLNVMVWYKVDNGVTLIPSLAEGCSSPATCFLCFIGMSWIRPGCQGIADLVKTWVKNHSSLNNKDFSDCKNL